MRASSPQLHQLAGLYDIKTSYLDMELRPRPASNESLLAILKAMGAPVVSMSDVPSAIQEKQQQYWRLPLEPVNVLWENEILTLNLRLPATQAEAPISASLKLESGEQRNFTWRGEETSIIDSVELAGVRYVTIRLYLPQKLPLGYHNLKLEICDQVFETLIISAPLKSYSPPENKEKLWGLFIPLYALHTRNSWGVGDFSDISNLMKWVSGLGGHIVGSLPLLPSFFDKKIGPSPYMPASRLFWNEFYLDISQIPELERCMEALNLINSTGFQKEIKALRNSRIVDYNRQVRLKRQVLEELTTCFFEEKPERFFEFQLFLDNHSTLEDYARFRAAGEQHGICWYDWPQRMRDGQIKEGDYAEKAKQYHLYTQWLAQEQIQNLSHKDGTDNVHLYLDMPVGVHPYSYDVWRERESFVMGVNGGAPPDPVFTSGQNWSFPPLHPEKMRNQGYRYFIQSLRHQLQQTGMMRIDHMMHLHRLFWIPEGMTNQEGVYVGYRSNELYAILTLESNRQKSILIGEDLGMVPPEVRPNMEKHGIYRMYVGQYELIVENQLGKIPSQSVANLNTHDMFPFAAFWQESDILERQKLKLIDAADAQKELEQRRKLKSVLISILQYKGLNNEISQDTQATLKAVLNLLAASPAYAVLVNLEDLWLESQPQNIPGLNRSHNWSRKARYGFEGFSQLSQVTDILQEIDRTRKGVHL